MKNSFAISILLLISSLATSCWRVDEDWSLCGAESSLTLNFKIHGLPNAKFTNYIGVVDIYLFDAERNFLRSVRLSESDGDNLRQAVIDLAPGIYHVICWGNVLDDMRVSLGDGRIENSYMEIVSSESGDPLYYAPYTEIETIPEKENTLPGPEIDYSVCAVEVLPGRRNVKNFTFVKIHRTVEMFVNGWTGGGAPLAERTGASGGSDFMLHADTTPRNFKRLTSPKTIGGVEMFTAYFHSPLIPLEGYPKWVYLCDPATGEPVGGTKIDLRKFVAANGIEDDSYIPIYYNFNENGGVGVSITLPPWSDNGVHW